MIWTTSNKKEPDVLSYSTDQIIKLIVITRLSLYNQNLPCGTKAIREQLKNIDIQPLPALSRISYVLRKYGLTFRRTGYY
ncbi:hypothetical protein KKA15_04305 [Patescibacteria group bacterium]|nr:hypothetical protein [Patescibacteria group bacterium]